jgi:type II secretory pathway pseudopilin PulG
MYIKQQGAMFGLDARIALAIFGALSVISGAALYSAIQSAKVERVNQGFSEIYKATEAYYLDNFKNLPQNPDSGSFYGIYLSDLIENRELLSTWNGPYINGDAANPHLENNLSKEVDPGSFINSYLFKSSAWGDFTPSEMNCSAVGDADCSSWIGLFSGGTVNGQAKLDNLFNKLDNKIDGGDGESSGKIRYFKPLLNHSDLYYQGMPRKRSV